MSFSQSRLKGATILICDDDKDIRDVLAEAFKEAGSQVVTVENTIKAWQVLQKYSVDCIVSDIQMDEGDGVEFAKKIHQSDKPIPFFLITGFSHYQGHEVKSFGVEAIFFKPLHVEEIVEAVALKLESL